MPRKLSSEAYRYIILALCHFGGRAGFSDIRSFLGKHGVGFSPQHLNAALSLLRRRGIISRVDKGVYILERVAPICLVSSSFDKFSYVGALGRREHREISEPEIAIWLLKKAGFELVEKVVITTEDGRKNWADREIIFGNIGISFVSDLSLEELKNIELMRRRVEEIVYDLSDRTIPIIDCTSLNKVYTIAAYQVATTKHLPLIYIYEDTKELVWLQSVDELRKRINSLLLSLLSKSDYSNRDI